MHSRPPIYFVASLGWLGLLTGCGGGGGGSSSAPAQVSSAPAPAGESFAQIVLQSVLERAIPATIDTLVFRGLNPQGSVIFGPETRAKAPRIELERVPLGVTQLHIEYFQGTIVRGRVTLPVTLRVGQSLLIESPAFSDVVYPLASISLTPPSLNLLRGQQFAFQLEGFYADQTSRDLGPLAQWSASPEGIVEVLPNGVVRALQVGECTLTAQVESFTSQCRLSVARPPLVDLQLSHQDYSLLEGQEFTLQAVGLFQDGVQEVPDSLSWSSEDPQVASVGPDGVVQAHAPGQTRILGQSGTLTAALNLSVSPDLTIQELFSQPARQDIPLGLNAGFRLFGRYRNGNTVDLTQLAEWTSSHPDIAKVAGVQVDYPVVRPSYTMFLATYPPPFFPNSRNVIGGVSRGQATIRAEYQGQGVDIPVQVTDPVPLFARVLPALTQLLTPGQSVQLDTECILSDASVELNRPDTSIEQAGTSAQLSASNLAAAQQPGATLFRAVIPVPNIPDTGVARYTYFNDGYADLGADYFRYPFDLASIVVNQPLGIAFTPSALTSLKGSLLAESAAGLFWAQGNRVQFFSHLIQLSQTSNVRALAAGRFSGTRGAGEVFFAGTRAPGGVDYGVILSHTPEQRIRTTTPPYTQVVPAQTEYRTFADTPHGLSTAVTADFDGNGRLDAALFYRPSAIAQQLEFKVRLSDQDILDVERAPLASPELSQVAAGDLNGDGSVDLVGLSPSIVQVWLNDGQAHFTAGPQLALNLPLEARVSQLNLGDIDGDGHSDLCFFQTLGFGWRDYFVYYGDGTGQFPRSHRGDSGYRVQASRLADLTGDGRADLVTLQSDSIHTLIHSNNSQRRTSMSIHPGSDQGFLPQQVTAISSDSSPASFLLRDQNNDGRLDLVCSLQYTSNFLPFGNGWATGSLLSQLYHHYRGLVLLRNP